MIIFLLNNTGISFYVFIARDRVAAEFSATASGSWYCNGRTGGYG
ncbi:MAG TPA: hypothetical protein PKK43_15725 [Spirochaetota bacterium]|nr:hypothetical protein [Spirochaetota bacterium]